MNHVRWLKMNGASVTQKCIYVCLRQQRTWDNGSIALYILFQFVCRGHDGAIAVPLPSVWRQRVQIPAVVVVVEASAPKVYPRVTLASASTLSGSVVRTLRGGERLPNMFYLVASSLGHLRSQCSIVWGSSLQSGHRGPAEESRRLA